MTSTAFRDWRHSCPFLAGLITLGAGVELMVVVSSAPGVVRLLGRGAAETWMLGALLVVAGLTLWYTPTLRYFAGTAAIVAGLLSLVLANLGGYLLGFLLAVLGGALALAWRPLPDSEPVGSQ
ncbi:MAG: hypothetical protein HOY78_23610 [Saccharothrix sp.]|nr:hypothetical protein [Saccharothrix sp.]